MDRGGPGVLESKPDGENLVKRFTRDGNAILGFPHATYRQEKENVMITNIATAAVYIDDQNKASSSGQKKLVS